jgi:hypothetical protein
VTMAQARAEGPYQLCASQACELSMNVWRPLYALRAPMNRIDPPCPSTFNS